MSRLLLALASVLGMTTLAAPPASGPSSGAPRSDRAPVLIELFTSEGCSSCPPADRLLAALDREQSVPGAEVMVVGFHVDYWNRLGWADPFSSPEASALQSDAATALGRSGIFTPQGLVNGRGSVVANDEDALVKAVTLAAQARAAPIRIEARTTGSKVFVRAWLDRPLEDGEATAYVALTESGLSTRVSAGENAGHTLNHAPVVRVFRRHGRWASEAPVELELPIDPRWKRDNLRVRVWLGSTGTRAVLAAGQAVLVAAPQPSPTTGAGHAK